VNYTKTFVPTKISGGSATPAYLQWFDPSTFSPAANNSFGTCGQGGIRGPRYTDVDLALHKEIPISEGKRFEFRAEAYNAFNHPILAVPDLSVADVGARGFGSITNSQGSRQFQLGMKFYF
jgi:hypothetical protein